MAHGEGALAGRAGRATDGVAASPPGIDGETFRLAMRDLAGAVAILTTSVGGRRTGCTISSLQCYAVAPPILLVSLGRDSSSARMIAESGRFGISLLGQGMGEVAAGFARPAVSSAEERFRHGRWSKRDGDGQWLADGALAGFDCAVDEMIYRYSHVIVLGKVVAMAQAADPDRPLLYWRQGYRELA
ncbi:MAG: flavin reductase family protein [Xanthobacteraceae bacterium]|nr:flavin reductase family protein [Xanthobacteraceae bacterium]